MMNNMENNTVKGDTTYDVVDYYSLNMDNNNDDYSFDDMSAMEAYFIFYNNYRNENFPYFNELAEVILNDKKEPDPMFAYFWVSMRKSHVEEFYEYLIKYLNAEAAAAWVKNINDKHNLDIKKHIVELDLVSEFVLLYNSSLRYNASKIEYTMEDFYSDLPKEYQLRIIL